jgi:hypothetical protein
MNYLIVESQLSKSKIASASPSLVIREKRAFDVSIEVSHCG